MKSNGSSLATRDGISLQATSNKEPKSAGGCFSVPLLKMQKIYIYDCCCAGSIGNYYYKVAVPFFFLNSLLEVNSTSPLPSLATFAGVSLVNSVITVVQW